MYFTVSYFTQKNCKKKINVWAHFLTLLIIIILVTPPILYIVFWLHPITKIPSPKGIGRTTADSFFISCNDAFGIDTLQQPLP